MEKPSTNRDVTLDIVKGIGILCVVVAHAHAPFSNFVYLFHMALFFMASGYCYNRKYAMEDKLTLRFLWKRVKGLWLPFVFWTALFFALNNVFVRLHVYTDDPRFLELVKGNYVTLIGHWSWHDRLAAIKQALIFRTTAQVGGAMWFLGTLFQISVLFVLIDYVLHKLFSSREAVTLAAQGILSGVFLGLGYYAYLTGGDWYGWERSFSCYCLFYIGYLLKRFHLCDGSIRPMVHAVRGIIGVAVLVVALQLGDIEIATNEYVNPAFLLLCSLAGWYMVYEAAYFIAKAPFWREGLVVMGQNTLTVLIFHFLCFKIVSFIGLKIQQQPSFLMAAFPVLYNGGLWWLAYTLVGITVPVLMSLIWKKLCQTVSSRRKVNA